MRILIVDFEFPEPDRSSGGHRLFEIVKILAAEHEVAFLSWDYWWKWQDQDPKYERALNELGVKTKFVKNAAIDEATGKFIAEFMPEVAVLSRYYIANIFYPYLINALPMCRTILDTVDVHYMREKRQAQATGVGNNHKETELQERAAAEMVDRVWVVTPDDAKYLEKTDKVDLMVVPNIHPAAVGERKGRLGREGIVFVGNYIHQPNLDAVWFLATQIMPKLRERGIKEPIRVAGAAMEQLGRPYEGIEYLGWVEDLDGLLSSSVVGVSPLRYGSGMKGKIGSYMRCGLPVVTTSIGAEGMGLTHNVDAMIADSPEQFALDVEILLSNSLWWERISDKGSRKVAEWSPESVKKNVLESVAL